MGWVWDSIKTGLKATGIGVGAALAIDGAGLIYKMLPESEKYTVAVNKDKVEWVDHELTTDFLWNDRGIRNFIEVNNIDDANAVLKSIKDRNDITYLDTYKGMSLEVPARFDKENSRFYAVRELSDYLKK